MKIFTPKTIHLPEVLLACTVTYYCIPPIIDIQIYFDGCRINFLDQFKFGYVPYMNRYVRM